ncbi:flavin-containing monooxygenase [Mycobacterium sp. C31M]
MTYHPVAGDIDFDPEWLREKYRDERDRRIRPEGKAQYTSAKGDYAHFADDPWTPRIEREPISEHTNVIIVGGGYGGLLMGARLYESGVTDVRVIEVGGDFGGVWYWNRYPGAMCDIEAHTYLPLAEELDWIPQHRYSYAPELLELSRTIGKTYQLYDRACFHTSVEAARWDADQSRWSVSTDRGDQLTADYLVIACGRMSQPKFPVLPGVDEFTGHIFHTSRWDYDYTGPDLTALADKRVGVIGTGATGLQVVPAVAPYVKELVVFQRTPSTVGVRDQREVGPDWVDRSEPGWQRRRRDNFQQHIMQGTPAGHVPLADNAVGDGWTESCAMLAEPEAVTIERLGRKPTAAELAVISEMNDFRLMNQVRARVRATVTDPDTAAILEPWYRWWCKRAGWHDDYLEAFNRDNVRLVDTDGRGLEAFTPTGVVAGGAEHRIDCLIMATGFDAPDSFAQLTGFEFEGRDGTTLTQHWSTGIRTLHGMATDGFPSLFFLGGNAQTAAALNAVHMLDEQACYIARAIAGAVAHDNAVIEASPEAIDEWVAGIVESPLLEKQLEFLQDCTPGYFNAEGSAKSSADLFTGLRYPAGPLAYFEILRNWDFAGPQPGYRLTPRDPAPTDSGERNTS